MRFVTIMILFEIVRYITSMLLQMKFVMIVILFEIDRYITVTVEICYDGGLIWDWLVT